MVAEADAQQRFTLLFEMTYGHLIAYVKRRVPAEHVDDLVADVYVSAWTNLDSLPADALPWLYRTAWNAVGNDRRAGERRSTLTGRLSNELATSPLTRDPGDQAVSADRARQALAHLRVKDREAVQLLCWEQLTVSDAASVLGCSETALTVRLHRARRRLSAFLSALDDTSQDPRLRAIDRTREQTT